MIEFSNNTKKNISCDFFEKILRIMEKEMGKTFSNISLVLTNNDEIQKLNLQYRSIDTPTDVLSFPYEDNTFFGCKDSQLLGEIFISLEKVEQQSKVFCVSFEHELSKMFVHGVLHLLGYDHETEEEYEEMKKNEIKIEHALQQNKLYEYKN